MTATELVWVLVSDGFYRSKGGRFDVWAVMWGRWVAIDGDAGVVRRFTTEAEAKQWCERRARDA